eukprot:9427956-Lingulodinium_polyedra.AAC.1
MAPGPRLRRLALPSEKLRASQELRDAKGKRYRVIAVRSWPFAQEMAKHGWEEAYVKGKWVPLEGMRMPQHGGARRAPRKRPAVSANLPSMVSQFATSKLGDMPVQ